MMNDLPSDPFILLSYVNTKLRDDYWSIAELCDDLNVDKAQLEAKLLSIGYAYNPQLNKFI